MQLTTAQSAASLLPNLVAEQMIVAKIQECITNNAAFSGLVGIIDTVAGDENMQLPALSPTESAPLFAALLQLHQGKLAALQAELDAL